MNLNPGRITLLKIVIILMFATAFALAGLTSNRQTADASASGPSPSNTGAPGENNCTACHNSYPVNSGTGGVQIAGIPHNYLPGQQVSVTVTASQADAVIYGFQLTAVDRLGRQAGTLTPPVQTPAQTRVISGVVGGNQRRYIEHTIDGILPTQFGSKSWTFTWTAPAQRVGKIDFYAAGNSSNSDGGTSGDYIYTTSRPTLSGTAVADFDGDFSSEIAVFRPSNGIWFSYNLATGAVIADQFGAAGDKIVPGDYDGDGKTDFAVFRPSTGDWYLRKSTQGISVVHFGSSSDLPAVGDYDGDGKTDIAVFRPSNGTWYLNQSTAGLAIFLFGLNGDKPVPGDYDADGKTDIAVFRPSNGVWYEMRSTGSTVAVQFGTNGDKPVQSDYDGDGKTDLAVYRPSSGAWFRLNSATAGDVTNFGVSTDIPTPGDYDGDGKADIALFRPSNGIWYLLRSSDNAVSIWFFGSNGDVPVPSGYNPD